MLTGTNCGTHTIKIDRASVKIQIFVVALYSATLYDMS